jgi:hypothetical protein
MITPIRPKGSSRKRCPFFDRSAQKYTLFRLAAKSVCTIGAQFARHGSE